MGTITIAPSLDTLTDRAATALVELLEYHYQEVALERYGPGPPECPCQRRAQAAHRITELCRKLVEELRRCERYEKICLDIEDHGEDAP